MALSKQEYWSGLLFPSPGDLPHQGSNLGLLYCRWMLYHLSHRGSLLSYLYANPRRLGWAYFNKWTRNVSASRYLYTATEQEKTGNSWPLWGAQKAASGGGLHCSGATPERQQILWICRHSLTGAIPLFRRLQFLRTQVGTDQWTSLELTD